jgi:hypothetical protein
MVLDPSQTKSNVQELREEAIRPAIDAVSPIVLTSSSTAAAAGATVAAATAAVAEGGTEW